MDKSKQKKQPRGRKRRLQLDDEEESHSRQNSASQEQSTAASNKTPSKSRNSTTSRKNPTSVTATKTSRSSKGLKNKATSSSSAESSAGFSRSVDPDAPTPKATESDETTESHAAVNDDLQRAGASSPDPNCAICLGQMENKSFTDSCFHQFCFVCLLEWSKVKAECPLCKQSFKSIVHNVRSYKDYDQYELPRPENRLPMYDFSATGSGVRFRYRTTVTDHRYAHIAEQINQEIESRLLQRPSRSLPIPNYRRLRQPANSEFRRRVYLQRLKLSSQHSETRRRVRETSPTFFRDNPAQTHRLVPWVNRELNALLQGHGEQVAFVLDLIMGLIKRFTIDSEEFYQHVFPYIGRHTRQFMQEFMMFARSPYHMAAYDRHISYEPSNEPRLDSDSDSDHRPADNGNDSDVIVVSPGTSPPPPRGGQVLEDTGLRRNWSADPSFFPGFNPLSRSYGNDDLPSMNPYTGLGTEYAPPSASGWDSPTPGPSQLSMPGFLINLGLTPPPAGSRYTRICCGPNASWREEYSPTSVSVSGVMNPREQSGTDVTLPSTSQNDPIRCNNTDSDSNSSDIEIVDVEKPWNERSPIHLSSGGDTDYDVMITGMTHINDPIKTEKKKKKKHKRHTDDSHSEKRTEGDSRSADSGREMHAKKRRHRSRSRSLPSSYRNPSRSRTRSLSPLRLTIFRSPEYQHKKFGYRTNSERMDEWSQGRSSSSSRRRSYRSQSSSGTDTESHLSITSHRQSSKSKHSCVEIVQYRKKSSKTKKHKKHKSKDRTSGFESEEKKHKKRKKHSRSVDDESEIMGTSKSHSKHKSKKKKHHKEKKKSHKKSKEQELESNVGQAEEKKKEGCYSCDSESDSDSDIDFIQNDESNQGGKIQQDKSSSTSRSQNFVPTGLEFEEVDAAQAAILDEELDSINRTLSSNDYINSLLTGNTFGQNKETHRFENNDPNKIVNPNDVFNQKTFKKHPFGHKKSGKTSQNVAMSNPLSTSAVVTTTPATYRENVMPINSVENSIQSNDISSCSDLDFERQLPSFLTFSNRNIPSAFSSTRRSPHLLSNMFNHGSWRNEPLSKKSCTATAPSYESPTSTATYFEKEEGSLRNVNDLVNVDSLSNDSYIDVTDMNVPTEPSLIPSYSTSRDSLKLSNYSANNYIDVVGDSDNETTNETNEMETAEISNLTQSKDIYKQEVVSEVDVENDDSDIECSLVEGHKTFEIGEDSDSDINVENIDEVHGISGNDIDILRHSDDEIIIDDGDAVISGAEKRMRNETLIVHPDSETDLDYNCEDENDVNGNGSTYQTTEDDSQHTEIYEEEMNTETDVHGENNAWSTEHKSSKVTDIDGNTEGEIPQKMSDETANELSMINNEDKNNHNAFETEHSDECDEIDYATEEESELSLGDSKKNIKPAATDSLHHFPTGTSGSSSQNSTSDNDLSMNDKVENEHGECTGDSVESCEEEINQSLETFRTDRSGQPEQLEVESDSFTDINKCVEHGDKNVDQTDEIASSWMNSGLGPGPSNLDVSSLQSSRITDQLVHPNTNSTSQSIPNRGGSGFRWTANPLYQARRLSLSELPPESQYMVHLPSQRAPSYSPASPSSAIPSPLSSPDTEETFSSYEVWDGPYSPNSHDGDFQVED